MKAKIKVNLSEAGQKAQILAGRDARKTQTVEVEILDTDMQYCSVTDAGELVATLHRADNVGYNREVALDDISEPALLAWLRGDTDAHRAHAAHVAKQEADQRAREAAEEAKNARGRAQVQAAIDAFFADPGARLHNLDDVTAGLPRGARYYIDDNARLRQLEDEIARRNDLDRKAAAATAAAKEQAKLDYLHAWVDEHGTLSQRERQASGLLCRDEAVSALAASSFAAIGAPKAVGEWKTCSSRDCPCWNDGMTCLDEAAFESYKRLTAAGATVDEFSRGRDCLRDDEAYYDEAPETAGEWETRGRLHIHVGPFHFQRMIRLA